MEIIAVFELSTIDLLGEPLLQSDFYVFGMLIKSS